jgi:hypothetical protein
MKTVSIALFVLSAVTSQAVTLSLITGAADPAPTGDTLTNAVLAPSSGIGVVGGSIIYQGTTDANQTQSATYTGFNLAPTSGATPTLALPNGILLTSGSANLPNSNTVGQFNPAYPGTGGNALLTTLSGLTTYDANALTFSFTVDPGFTSVSAQFVFGTDEFPTEEVTDIFGFFVDGVNFAKFSTGELISNTPGNPTNFIANPIGAGSYPIEYNGLTKVFTVVGNLDPNLATHSITIALADTTDSIFDSGVFIGGLTAGTDAGGGGIDPDPNRVPEGGTTIAMLGLALAGIAGLRKKLGL